MTWKDAADTMLNISADVNGSISSKTLLAGERDDCTEGITEQNG